MLLIRERVGGTVPLWTHHFENLYSYLWVEAEVHRLHRLFAVDLFSPNYAITALMLGTYYKSEQELRLNMKGSLKIENYRMKYVELWWRGLLCFVINAFDASFFNGNVEIKEESYCGASRRRKHKLVLMSTSLVF